MPRHGWALEFTDRATHACWRDLSRVWGEFFAALDHAADLSRGTIVATPIAVVRVTARKWAVREEAR